MIFTVSLTVFYNFRELQMNNEEISANGVRDLTRDTKTLMELGLNPADKYDMNLALNKDMEFCMQSDEYATDQMRSIVEDYIEVGLITATDNVDEVIESLWHPIGSAE